MSGKRTKAENNYRNRMARKATTKQPALRSYCGKPYKPTGCKDMRPYSPGRLDINFMTPARQKHVDELKARRERREARRLTFPRILHQKTNNAPLVTPILSDNPEWCAFDYQPNRKPIPYRALTSTGHMEAPRTVREWAGGVLSATAKAQDAKRGIHSENLPNRHERPGETVKARAIEIWQAQQAATA